MKKILIPGTMITVIVGYFCISGVFAGIICDSKCTSGSSCSSRVSPCSGLASGAVCSYGSATGTMPICRPLKKEKCLNDNFVSKGVCGSMYSGTCMYENGVFQCVGTFTGKTWDPLICVP
ncbi:MAG: hypothetical protein JW745_08335 [Sedimentisphaerales bacterium]|nr:hypothetical protein [Sedimentisphaerales bacterium]